LGLVFAWFMLAGELVFDGGDGCDRLVGFALRVVAARLWLSLVVDVGSGFE
jgi:hypothetical protein